MSEESSYRRRVFSIVDGRLAHGAPEKRKSALLLAER
jgi:hypothetical protein